MKELGCLEMIGTIVYQLTRNRSIEDIKKGGFATCFVDHTTSVYPQSVGGTLWSAMTMQSKGDVITDLHEKYGSRAKGENDR